VVRTAAGNAPDVRRSSVTQFTFSSVVLGLEEARVAPGEFLRPDAEVRVRRGVLAVLVLVREVDEGLDAADGEGQEGDGLSRRGGGGGGRVSVRR